MSRFNNLTQQNNEQLYRDRKVGKKPPSVVYSAASPGLPHLTKGKFKSENTILLIEAKEIFAELKLSLKKKSPTGLYYLFPGKFNQTFSKQK